MAKTKKYRLLARYRLAKKIVNLYRSSIAYFIRLRYRLARRIRFKITRLAVFAFFRLWIKEVIGVENIPIKKAAIFVSNHTSYYDFLILGALLKNYVTFIASKKIEETFFIRWFTKLHNIIYVNQERPGYSFFRNMIRHLKSGKTLIIYPEGTRSRTGKMLAPKYGFVKLAIIANVPVIPIAMKGTYEILAPSRHIPRLKKCSVVIAEKIYISPDNYLLKDIFISKDGRKKNINQLTKNDLQKIAIYIMDEIRAMADEQWDIIAINEIEKFRKTNSEIVDNFCDNKISLLHKDG